jgi:hypothetical protein
LDISLDAWGWAKFIGCGLGVGVASAAIPVFYLRRIYPKLVEWDELLGWFFWALAVFVSILLALWVSSRWVSRLLDLSKNGTTLFICMWVLAVWGPILAVEVIRARRRRWE